MFGKMKHEEYHKCQDTDKHHDYCDYEDYEDDCHCSSKKCDDHKDHPKKKHGNCVKEVLEAILEAQKKVKKGEECKNSCKESIKELLGEEKKPKKNTIPFLLYCGDCEPFKATGVTTVCHQSKEKKFACITSFIFRIKDFDGKCAVLELLTFKPSKYTKDTFQKNISKSTCSPCSQIDCENVKDLISTGICINVDLSCFCAVTCLPAVRL